MTYGDQHPAPPYSHRLPDRPAPAPRRRRNTGLIVAVAAVAAGVVLAIGGVIVALALTGDDDPTTGAQASSAPSAAITPITPAAPASVAGLIARLGCRGGPIGTQLYSKETGRCTLAGAEITIATFDSDQLRDQWVTAARQFGGNLVVGPGWAAMASTPDAAGTVVQKLGGQRL